MADETMVKEIRDLFIDSEDKYAAALDIRDAIGFGFYDKLIELFHDQIFKLIKESGFPKTYKEGDDWLLIPLRNGLLLSVLGDLNEFVVQKNDEPVEPKRKKKIIEVMEEETGTSNDPKKMKEWGAIWANTKARYPELREESDDWYEYKLYQIYSKDPQSAVDWIVSIAKKLQKI